MKCFRIIIENLLTLLLLFGCSDNNPMGNSQANFFHHFTFSNSYFNLINNGELVDGRLYGSNKEGFFIFDDMSCEPQVFPISGNSSSMTSKPFIGKEFIVSCIENNNKQIRFTKIASLSSSSDTAVFDIKSLGGIFANGNFYFAEMNWLRPIGCIGGDNVFLTSINGSINIQTSERPYYLLIKLDPSRIGNEMIINAEVYPLDIDMYGDNNVNLYFMPEDIIWYKDFFIFSISSASGVYIAYITPDGAIELHHNPFTTSIFINEFFEYKNMLWAQLSDYSIVYSTNGRSWSRWGYLTPEIMASCEVDGYVFMAFFDKLFLYRLEDDLASGAIFRFPDDELSGAIITSINNLNGNIVLTTTNGIYYKSLHELMKQKITADVFK